MSDGRQRHDVAECERKLAACEAEHGRDHMKTADASFDLALALSQQGRIDEAIVHARRALQIALGEGEGDTWWFVRLVRGALGSLLSVAGQHEEAISLLQREADVAEPHPAGRLAAHWILGEALVRACEWRKAIASFEIALAVATERNNQRQVEALRSYIADARAKLGDA